MTPVTEVPKQAVKNPKAVGRFVATLQSTKSGFRLRWHVTYSRLTGQAMSVDLHQGKPGKAGPSWLRLCSPCTSGAHGQIYFSPPELKLAQQGSLYVNLRTPRNPSGEIRGQVRVS